MIAHGGLAWRAAQTPEAPALETDAGTWSFADLADRARRGAGYLRAAAPAGDSPVGLLMTGDARFAAWFHALRFAGRVVLPLNLRLTAGELVQQLVSARTEFVLGDPGDARLGEIAARVPGLRAEVAPRFDSLPNVYDRASDDDYDGAATLAVLYTSGTSGSPKGACLTWDNFVASARAAEERLGSAVGARWLACMPLFHVGGLSILVRSVLFGGPARLQSRFDPAAVSEALDAGDVVGLSLVPTMLSRLLAHRGGREPPPALRVLLLGGAAATPRLLDRALAAGYPVCPTYGLTEATSQVATSAPPAAGAAQPAPMLPLSGTAIRIAAGDRELPTGAPGEILVRGPTVMRGYLNDPAATARALRGGWLHTGDIGYLDEMGALHVLDRRDDLIVTGGENVYPAEIEAVLLEHPAVADAAVTGVPDADLGARVVAWVVPVSGATTDPAQLQEHCRARLAGYKRPRDIQMVPSLPRNAAGKLQRRRLVATTRSS